MEKNNEIVEDTRNNSIAGIDDRTIHIKKQKPYFISSGQSHGNTLRNDKMGALK